MMEPLDKLVEMLRAHQETLDAEQWSELEGLPRALQINLAAANEDGRNLRIAVVGQMKAGKSSFLNAAFFGRDLLPKADTPMTAALTKVVYADHESAEVVFYSREDWEDITALADSYARCFDEEMRRMQEETGPFSSRPLPSRAEVESRLPENVMASRELVEKARLSGLDLDVHLGTTRVLDQIGGAAELAQALHDYVGSGGRYTSITKMTVLHVKDDRLRGLEIIDTPGFNDPVLSRGQITRTFLGQCDVIFLLSSVSQFITAADMAMLREQLPEAGIDEKAVFLLGGQRDVALRQDADLVRRAHSATERFPEEQRAAARVLVMLQYLDKKMAAYAERTLDEQMRRPGMDERTRRVLAVLRQTPPRFISSWSWLVAEHYDKLSNDDREQLDALRHATGHDFSADDLRLLSNIPLVSETLLSQREYKRQLIEGKAAALREGALASMGKRLAQIKDSLIVRQSRIRNGNIADLEAAEREAIQRLTKGKVKLEDVFDEQHAKVRQQFALLKTDVRTQATKYSRVESIKETSVESYQVSTSKWYNPFSWGSSETRYRDVVTVYASAQDAMEQVQVFANQAARGLQQAIMGCVELDVLRRNLSQAAMSLFDTGSADFDGELMLAEVNKSLRRITIPEIDFGHQDYSQSIAKSFGSGRVSESQIYSLQESQRQAVAAILADLEREVEDKVKKINATLEMVGKNFVAQLTADLQTALAGLRDDIANKEATLKKIEQALLTVNECTALLSSEQRVVQGDAQFSH